MATARAEGERQHSEDRGAIAVTVTLFADLRRYLPPGVDGPHRRTVPAGSTVADLLDAIGIAPTPTSRWASTASWRTATTALHDGADVMLLSPMEGG